MLSVEAVAKVGGIFALLTLAHFIADWLFQSHTEAMSKATDSWVRGKHCLIYTVLLCLAIWLVLKPAFSVMVLIAIALWFSHFVEDTYLPVYIWAKYVRKPLEMADIQKMSRDLAEKGGGSLYLPPGTYGITPMDGFKAFASTGLGKILLITVDQIIHLVFLVPVAVVLAYPTAFIPVAGWIFTGLGGLWFLGHLGKKAL